MIHDVNNSVMNISPYAIPGIVKSNPTSELIINYVCDYFGQRKEDIKGTKRNRDYVTPRHIAMYLIKIKTSQPVVSIAKIFNKDHTSVLHAMTKINGFIEIKDFDTLRAIEKISNNLRTNN